MLASIVRNPDTFSTNFVQCETLQVFSKECPKPVVYAVWKSETGKFVDDWTVVDDLKKSSAQTKTEGLQR